MAANRPLVRCLVLSIAVLGCLSTSLAAPWRFAVVGDTRGPSSSAPVNTAALSAINQSLLTEGIDLVIIPGDLVYGSSTALLSQLNTWKTTMAPIYNAGIGVYPIRGNHETSGGTAVWRTAFPGVPQNGPSTPYNEVGLTYSFTHNDALFIGLDEYVQAHRVNQGYLDGLLADPDRPPHVFVYGHEPAFSASHTDTLAAYPGSRDAFWESLGNHGVPMYFCGHDHFYARSMMTTITYGWPVQQLIDGSGGAPFHVFGGYVDPRVMPLYSDDDHYGYMVISVEGPCVMALYKAQLDPGQPAVFAIEDHFSFRPGTGDVDGDTHVDVVDLLYLVDAFGSAAGEPAYSLACDFNEDDAVDVVDLLLMVDCFGT